MDSETDRRLTQKHTDRSQFLESSDVDLPFIRQVVCCVHLKAVSSRPRFVRPLCWSTLCIRDLYSLLALI